MRAVIQRVSKASVIVEGEKISEIKRGLLILLGIAISDCSDKVSASMKSLASLMRQKAVGSLRY